MSRRPESGEQKDKGEKITVERSDAPVWEAPHVRINSSTVVDKQGREILSRRTVSRVGSVDETKDGKGEGLVWQLKKGEGGNGTHKHDRGVGTEKNKAGIRTVGSDEEGDSEEEEGVDQGVEGRQEIQEITTISDGNVRERVKIKIQRTEDFRKLNRDMSRGVSFQVDVLESFNHGSEDQRQRMAETAASVLVDVIGVRTLRAKMGQLKARMGYHQPLYEIGLHNLTIRSGKGEKTNHSISGKSSRRGGEGRKDRAMLNGISTTLRPGRFTLLLGPPGSGKSTLLKSIAGVIGKSRFQMEVRGDR